MHIQIETENQELIDKIFVLVVSFNDALMILEDEYSLFDHDWNDKNNVLGFADVYDADGNQLPKYILKCGSKTGFCYYEDDVTRQPVLKRFKAPLRIVFR